MKTLCTHSLPKEKMPYLLRSGEGERYLFGRQVATVMANGRSCQMERFHTFLNLEKEIAC